MRITAADKTVVGFMGHWSILSLHEVVSKLASAEVCSGWKYTCTLRNELKKTGPSARDGLVIRERLE